MPGKQLRICFTPNEERGHSENVQGPPQARKRALLSPHLPKSFIPTLTLPVSFAGSDLNDGLWHSVSINARRNRITLTLDNDAASPAQDTTRMQIYSGNRYYFGGKFPSF